MYTPVPSLYPLRFGLGYRTVRLPVVSKGLLSVVRSIVTVVLRLGIGRMETFVVCMTTRIFRHRLLTMALKRRSLCSCFSLLRHVAVRNMNMVSFVGRYRLPLLWSTRGTLVFLLCFSFPNRIWNVSTRLRLV